MAAKFVEGMRWLLASNRCFVSLAVLAALGAGRAEAAWTVTATAVDAPHRQERGQPVVETTPVTVTVQNTNTADPVRVDALSLSFTLASSSADTQYDLVSPGAGVTVNAQTSRDFVFQARPRLSAIVFQSVTLTARVTANDFFTGATTSQAVTRTWSPQPGAVRVLGQSNLTSYDHGRKGLSWANGVWTNGTRVVVSDPGNHRVLIWNIFPTSNHQPPSIVLGQPDFGSLNGQSNDASARSMRGPMGVFSDGTRLFVCDTGNARVLIWTSFPTTNGQAANLVLGQPSFTTWGSAPPLRLPWTAQPRSIWTERGSSWQTTAITG